MTAPPRPQWKTAKNKDIFDHGRIHFSNGDQRDRQLKFHFFDVPRRTD
jgi:hypothetical protein